MMRKLIGQGQTVHRLLVPLLSLTLAALCSRAQAQGSSPAITAQPRSLSVSEIATPDVDPAFTRISTGPVATDGGDSSGAAWGDYDNDGFIDLFVANNPSLNALYRNNGDGTFSKITNATPALDRGYGCAWGDFNNDGNLDLLVSNQSANYLYRNEGHGVFTKVRFAGAGGTLSWSASWADYDRDGWLDLFIANGANNNDALLLNNHDGTFTRITNSPVVTSGGSSIAGSWTDFDGDGYPDLYVANNGGESFLFRNNGDATFTRVHAEPFSSDAGSAIVADWGDYDDDGQSDLAVARFGPNLLYHNNGDGTFAKVTTGNIVNDGGNSAGCAWGDYDNDGFLDLFVPNWQGSRPNFLYHNNGNSNAWLKVRCLGTVSNRDGIGAKVRVRAFFRGAERWQLREISGGIGFGQTPYGNFGLGDATNARTVRIEWPSRLVEEFSDVAAKQALTLTEPGASITPAGQTVPAGSSVSFVLTTTLPPPLTIQWRRDGILLPDETNRVLAISNMETRHAGRYSVTATQPDLRLSVTPPPAPLFGPILIAREPAPRAIPRGSSTTFQVLAEGSTPIGYQWRFNEVEIAGATNASLLVTNAQLPQEGTYSVVVSNSYGSVPSRGAALVVLVRPVITLHPVSQAVAAGRSVTLSAVAEGHPLPLTFRWRMNGLPMTNVMANGTNCFLTLTNLQATLTTNQFHLVVGVTNLAGGSLLSSNAVITILADTDADSMPDEWERANQFSPTNSADALLDTDGDGVANAAEYLAGTDPWDAQSYFKVGSITVRGSPGTASVAFLAFATITYTVLRRDCADSGAWVPIADVPATSTNRIVEVRDAMPLVSGKTQRYYRLITPRLTP